MKLKRIGKCLQCGGCCRIFEPICAERNLVRGSDEKFYCRIHEHRPEYCRIYPTEGDTKINMDKVKKAGYRCGYEYVKEETMLK